MEGTAHLCEPDNEVDALAIRSHLEDKGIECVVVRHQDTALPGITDRHRGWGEIRVPEDELARAQKLLAELWDDEDGLRPAEDLEEAAMAAAPPNEGAPGASQGALTRMVIVLVLVLGLLAVLRLAGLL